MFFGAYWSPRPESADDAAARVSGFLAGLAKGWQELSQWNTKGRKRQRKVLASLEPAAVRVQMTQNRLDSTGEPIPDLGWSLDLWNGGEVSFRATIGLCTPNQLNSVVLSFGPRGDGPSQSDQRTILGMMVREFDPDRAVATSNEVLDRKGAERPWEAAWLKYERGGRIQSFEVEP